MNNIGKIVLGIRTALTPEEKWDAQVKGALIQAGYSIIDYGLITQGRESNYPLGEIRISEKKVVLSAQEYVSNQKSIKISKLKRILEEKHIKYC